MVISDVNSRDFYWGVATAAFQIEGSPLVDGACASDWYNLSRMEGKIVNGDSAEVACDHYNRWAEDVEIMRKLGLDAYRFSISWSRIFPKRGCLNQKGMDFYNRLVDELCKAGITPFVTLFHWDLPEWIDKTGGWLNGDAIDCFVEYSQAVFDRIGDRVKHWATFNEPLTYYHSYVTGWHWPFHKNNYQELLTCWDNITHAHHRVSTIAKSRNCGRIGIVHSYHLLAPVSDRSEDRLAAVRADGFRNRWFFDRLFTGKYPQDMLELMKAKLPEQCTRQIPEKYFTQPDFVGLNYYATGRVQNDSSEFLGFSEPKDEFELQPTIESHPEGLYEMVRRMDEHYGPVDLFITENGYLEHEAEYAFRNPADDCARQKYLKEHLAQVEKCVRDGYPLKGYFHWSLLDNFEWRWGMGRRFGLVYVDRKTQDRTIKQSGWLYKEHIAQARKNPIYSASLGRVLQVNGV